MYSHRYDVDDSFLGFLLWFLGMIICAIVFIVGLVGSYQWFFSGRGCSEAGRIMNVDTQWTWSTGCFIAVDGQYLPWGEVIPVEENGKVRFTTKPRLTVETLHQLLRDSQ
ncbi:hypothetical protein [Hyphomicrobium sp.]|uniref:hypothetical protein n=1 Tax=Hyphomicrobium sp. TaxID=82 RepID=UPI001E145426|nr:hypothetical protein [Hyphomicrobium sp.]MBY0561431.1 hypothetical protein [Hyphomicrobium sp.]